MKMEIYEWTEIASAPNVPGVYAWYFNLEITQFDLDNTIRTLEKLRDMENKVEARQTVHEFLQRIIFRFFKEEPYSAVLKGPLKPHYKGILEHQSSLSDTLVDRIIEDPNRLFTMKRVLESSAPRFANPIYIGMAHKLRDRLKTHKQLIERYREKRLNRVGTPGGENKSPDQSFAYQVCEREILPSRLFVVVQRLEDCGNHYVDIENILNRIYYPLLGRN